MILEIKNLGSKLNTPANDGDVGYDVVAISDPNIVGEKYTGTNQWKSIDYIEYDTDIAIQFDETGYCTYAFPRSSISKYNLSIANSIGLIDSGYQNTIKFRFKYVVQPKDLVLYNGAINVVVDKSKIYKKGDKIGQLVFAKQIHPELIEYVDTFERSERGLSGFGSTGE